MEVSLFEQVTKFLSKRKEEKEAIKEMFQKEGIVILDESIKIQEKTVTITLSSVERQKATLKNIKKSLKDTGYNTVFFS